MKNHVLIFLLIASVGSVLATTSFATMFDCKTKQAFEWKDGKLNPKPFWENTVPKNAIPYQPLLRFDDQSSTLWIATSSAYPFGPIEGNIQVPMGAGNDLVFSGKTTTKSPDGSQGFTGNSILHIRGWKVDSDLHSHTVRLSFLFYEDSIDEVLTGFCTQKP